MKTTATRFNADAVTVLRFRREPDRAGDVIPPECHATFQPYVTVVFDRGDGIDDIVGRAKLYRRGNELMADLELVTYWEDTGRAITQISELVPSINGKILDAHEHTWFRVEVLSLSLGYGNADRSIRPLGSKLRVSSGKGLQ